MISQVHYIQTLCGKTLIASHGRPRMGDGELYIQSLGRSIKMLDMAEDNIYDHDRHVLGHQSLYPEAHQC